MIVKKIHIKNFKGFEKLDLSFSEQVTVLIGDNGSGKSSVLDSISIGLGTLLMKTNSSFGFNGKKTRPLLQKEIRKIIVSEDNVEYTDVLLSGEFEYLNKIYPWSREQKARAKNLTKQYAKEVTSLGEELTTDLTAKIDLPLIAYHSTARLAGQIQRKTVYEKIGSRLDGYYACLDHRSINQKFVSWFKTYEDSILKFEKDKSLYNAFTDAISSMVSDWTDVKFHWGLDDLVGKVDNNKWLPLSNLSDGYKGIINLAADIAYRAIKLNPHLGGRAVIDTKGIVLIDELDMHLHPKWQRSVIQDLKRTFPNIQFIITTHSPFIVQSLKMNEVINLDGGKPNENPNTKSIEEIAGDEMNMSEVRRSAEFNTFQELASKYFNLINEGKTSKNDNTTSKLKKELDELELNFSKDPVYLALMKAERKSELGE